MPLPHVMLPGEVARSSDVNDNFNYIMSIIGNLSTPSRVTSSIELQLGKRNNVLLTGAHDTGAVAREFFQIGWNVDYNLVGGVWKAARFLTGKGGTMLRIGEKKFEVWSTTNTTGDLNAYLKKVFSVNVTGGELTGYTFIPQQQRIQQVDRVAVDIHDYRLTTVFWRTRRALYNGIMIRKALTQHFQLINYGVPTAASGVIISVHAENGSMHNRVWIHQRGEHDSAGMLVAMAANGYGSGYGPIPLPDLTTYKGWLTITAGGPIDRLWVYIMGYLI